MMVHIRCVFCKKEHSFNVANEAGFRAWLSGAGNIQELLPELDSIEREELITHMCPSCISKTYHIPMKGEDWGKKLFNCPECDCTIYENDYDDSIQCYCPRCKSLLN